MKTPFFILLICFSIVSLQSVADNGTLQPQVGWLENIRMYPSNLLLTAKIDTGADHSSIDAYGIKKIIKSGETFIQFAIKNNQDNLIRLEKKLIRTTKVKQKLSGFLERYVIHLEICMGGKIVQIPVNLSQRKHFKYRMLIGRSALKTFMVNPSKTFINPPNCD